ncbi:zinc ABC transporter substrate-binding protein [Clostridium sp. A1-XYC3]|uniref:Zinc ABC transporter substrate-binding protein n=1 Tax=Clostridium tanneri TaxID=3037988 RepID=A0ABU4JPJ1_9CLOT|nr:zinc ABC transporter substrate-binding protein [Clostridium sp. A1-XYC3]MDW8800032.1 zinc ABC transporter substrate-binding protein [Clostridium sp. A1-XYC3]
MKNLRKKLGVFLVFIIIFLVGCGSKVEKESAAIEELPKMETKKNVDLNIVTTDKLLYSMVKTLVKEKHLVEYMFKDRESEINFTFSSDSLNNVAKKDLFIYMGAGFEPWINDFIDKLNKSRVGVINVSRGVNLISYNKVVKYKDVVLKDNPYYLLNIDNYKVALLNIKNSIQDRDPKNRDQYEKNFSEQLKRLEGYQNELKTIRDKLADYTFIVVEDELSYFVKYNDFKVMEINSQGNEKRILPQDSNAALELESKLKESKKLILLYNNDTVLKDNEALIGKYNIKTVNIKMINDESSYDAILKANIESLKKVYEEEPVIK